MKASDKIIKKLNEQPKKYAEITQLNGGKTNLFFVENNTFWSDNLNKLNNNGYDFKLFDILEQESYRFKDRKIPKGNARNNRLGDKNCDMDTVVGIFGYKYLNAKTGDSILEPTHVFAAILDWANVAKNIRGFIQFI